MKASELIEKLQALKEQFGDLEVEHWDERMFYNEETGHKELGRGFFPVDEVAASEKDNKRSIKLK